MTFLNPRKWNVACWVLVGLWLVPSILMNVPLQPSIENWESSRELEGSRYAAYDFILVIGWPFPYLEIDLNGPNPSTRTYTFVYAVFNFLLVITTIIGLIYAVQNWIPKLSIQTILIGMVLVAVVITSGRLVFSTEYTALHSVFAMAVYFSPIVAALAYYGYDAVYLSKTNHLRQQ